MTISLFKNFSFWLFLASLVAIANRYASSIEFVVPPIELTEAPYAEWAHKHWVRDF
jgi:hypothetical protein